MKLEPLFARVLLEREHLKTTTTLIIPETAQQRNAPTKGRVIAKGPTASDSVEIGQTYLFGQHAGTWLRADGQPAALGAPTGGDLYFVCSDEDLICKIVNE